MDFGQLNREERKQQIVRWQEQTIMEFKHLGLGDVIVKRTNRQWGKTTTAVNLLEVHQDAVLIVANQPQKRTLSIHSLSVRQRVFTVEEACRENFTRLHPFKRVIIDEGLHVSDPNLIKLFYSLGQRNIPTLVLGT